MDQEAFKKKLAINTNIIHLEKQLLEECMVLSDDEILKIANWNYRNFGFGYVSLSEFLIFKKAKYSKRLYSVDVKLWYRIINEVFKRDNYTCAYCGQYGGKLECDHIHPFSKGGTNDMENLTTSCRKCNRQKKNKTVSEFMDWKISKLE